jgi:hypothetical protein
MTKTGKRTTNHLIAILSMAMGRFNIRGYFTVQNGVWILWRGEAPYPLAGLRNITVTEDNHILLDLPSRAVILSEEAMALKNLSTVTSNQEATRSSLTPIV